MINRLQIGHTHFAHSYLLSGEDQPECARWKCPLSVKLFCCAAFNIIRHNYYLLSTQ